MRHSVLPALALLLAGATLPVLPAVAVTVPAPEAEKMTSLPDDWLDRDMDAPHGATRAADEEEPAVRTAETENWEDEGHAGGQAKAPVAGVDCPKPGGTTGMILGAVAGGLLGNVIDGGRHRAAGTLLGAGGGALLGREIEQRSAKCE